MKIYLEFKDLKSEKFWEVSVKSKVITTRWGKVGTAGQSKSKELDSPALAKAEAEKQKVSKIKKGYKEIPEKKKPTEKKKGNSQDEPATKKKTPVDKKPPAKNKKNKKEAVSTMLVSGAKSVELFLTDGNADKIYKAELSEVNQGWVVNFEYGRRGSSLKSGTKTISPLSYEKAKKNI